MRILTLSLLLLSLPARADLQCGPEGNSRDPYAELKRNNEQKIQQLNKGLGTSGVPVTSRATMVEGLNRDLVKLCQAKKIWEASGTVFAEKAKASQAGGCEVFGELTKSYGALEQGSTLYRQALGEVLKKQIPQFDSLASEELKVIKTKASAATLLPNFQDTWASNFNGGKSTAEASKLGKGFFANLLQQVEGEKSQLKIKQKSFTDMKTTAEKHHATCPSVGSGKGAKAGEQGAVPDPRAAGNQSTQGDLAAPGDTTVDTTGGSATTTAEDASLGDTTLSGKDKKGFFSGGALGTGSLLTIGALGAAGTGAFLLLKGKGGSGGGSDAGLPGDLTTGGKGTDANVSVDTGTGPIGGGKPRTSMLWSSMIHGIVMEEGATYQSPESFETMVGKKMSISANITSWFVDESWSDFNTLYADKNNPANNWANQATDAGQIPMLMWQPKDDLNKPTDCKDPKYLAWIKRFSPKRIAAGDFDTYLRKWAKQLKAWGKPLYLRPMHELNMPRDIKDLCGTDYYTSWDAELIIKGETINTRQDHIDAWRHMVKVFREEGAANVKWAWTVLSYPSQEFGGGNPISLKSIYPGDEYVDWIGIECYVFKEDPWKNCRDLMSGIYREATALSSKTPLFVAEMGMYENPRKAEWLKDAFSPDSPNAIYKIFPRISAIMYWNDSRYKGLWINSSPESIKTFKEAIAAPVYKQPGEGGKP